MPTGAVGTLTTRQLRERLARGEKLTLLDVREPDEFEDWHIPGASNVPVGSIVDGAAKTPDGPVLTICAHGARSRRAAEALHKRGVEVSFVEGGMVAWNSTYQRAPVPGPAGAPRVVQMKRLGKACLSYLVISRGDALVIDPSIDIEEYVEAAREEGATIRTVVDTHAHADHVSGALILADATGAAYHAPSELGERVPHEPLRDGAELRVGDATLRIVATPGHTPGSVTLLLDGFAFTGDTLFAQSVGRPDLGQDPRPNAAVLFDSLHERLLKLPESTLVLPAHAGGLLDPRDDAPVLATLGDLARREAPLRMAKAEFVDWVARHASPKPANFGTIKRINRGEEPLPDMEDVRELEAGPNRCAVR